VPLSEFPETVPWPDAVAEHDENSPSNPPAGTARLKLTLEPDTLPLTVPVPFVPLLVSVSASVPLNDVPDCVNTHVISPAPDESVAVPDQEPLTAAVVDGEGDGLVGVEELPPPLQPDASTARQNAALLRAVDHRGTLIC
jgi:hypothetical protein